MSADRQTLKEKLAEAEKVIDEQGEALDRICSALGMSVDSEPVEAAARVEKLTENLFAMAKRRKPARAT